METRFLKRSGKLNNIVILLVYNIP